MWVEDLRIIRDRLDYLPTEKGFPIGSRPLLYQVSYKEFGTTQIILQYYWLTLINDNENSYLLIYKRIATSKQNFKDSLESKDNPYSMIYKINW